MKRRLVEPPACAANSTAAAAAAAAGAEGVVKEVNHEEDYMSDAFLAAAPAAPRVDPRNDLPGWKRKARTELRREVHCSQPRAPHAPAQAPQPGPVQSPLLGPDRPGPGHAPRRQQQQQKKKAVLEVEARALGLATPLDPSNKGYAMLVKMGFKQGAGLGKSGEGRAEPVSVALKSGRSGVGRDRAVLEQANATKQAKAALARRRERAAAGLALDFRARKRREFMARQAERDLPPSQRACEQLDRELGVTTSEMWFVPPPPAVDPYSTIEPAAGADAAEQPEPSAFEQLDVPERLAIVTEYLRRSHRYCHWCGQQFETVDALAALCPGATYEDHQD